MAERRRRHSAELKTKVALEAIRGLRTANEIAAQYNVHPSLVTAWKKQALAAVPEAFRDGRARQEAEADAKEGELFEQIGRLKVELDWLKKRTGLVG